MAALIADDARLARTLRADGVHLGVAKDLAGAYAEAQEHPGPEAASSASIPASRATTP